MNLFIFHSIGGHFRRKVVANDWYANGDALTVNGKVEITQQSEYDMSNIEVQFKGLNENSGYHIHMVSVILYNICAKSYIYICMDFLFADSG